LKWITSVTGPLPPFAAPIQPLATYTAAAQRLHIPSTFGVGVTASQDRAPRPVSQFDCHRFDAAAPQTRVTLKVTFGSFVDYFRTLNGDSLCTLLGANGRSDGATAVYKGDGGDGGGVGVDAASLNDGGGDGGDGGRRVVYEHALSMDGPWTVTHGDDARRLGGGAAAAGRAAPVGPYWGVLFSDLPAAGCGHETKGDDFHCNIPYTFDVFTSPAPRAQWATSGAGDDYDGGVASGDAAEPWTRVAAFGGDDVVTPLTYASLCAPFDAYRHHIGVRITMGANVDYVFPLAGRTCTELFATPVGGRYRLGSLPTPTLAPEAMVTLPQFLGGAPREDLIEGDARSSGPFWGARDAGTGADDVDVARGGCGHLSRTDAAACARPFTVDIRAAPRDAAVWRTLAHFDGTLSVLSTLYIDGAGAAGDANFVLPCSTLDAHRGNSIRLRVTMGTWV
jgi:hypothetical protein